MTEDEEKLQLRADVERLRRCVLQKDEMIEEMEQDLAKIVANSKSEVKCDARERELSMQIRDLQILCDSHMLTISNRESEIESLKKENLELGNSIREIVNRTSDITETDELSNSLIEAEMLKKQEELERTKLELNLLVEESAELKKELLSKNEDLEIAGEHVRRLENHLKEREEFITSLESELFDIKNSGGSHATRGNSIFSEAMDAERKLEEDLKTLFREKQCLSTLVKRLTEEKEDAEQRARNAMSRRRIVKCKIDDVDFEELRRLRQKVRDLEEEKTFLWERLLIRTNSMSSKQLGAIIKGHFDGFRLSVEAFKSTHKELSQQNEKLFVENRHLRNDLEQVQNKLEDMTEENEILNRRLQISTRNSQNSSIKEQPQSVSTGPVQNNCSSRPQLFKSLVVPTKPLIFHKTNVTTIATAPTKKVEELVKENRNPYEQGDEEEMSEWMKKQLKLKESKKKPAANGQLNRIEFTMPERESLIKPQTLFARESKNEVK